MLFYDFQHFFFNTSVNNSQHYLVLVKLISLQMSYENIILFHLKFHSEDHTNSHIIFFFFFINWDIFPIFSLYPGEKFTTESYGMHSLKHDTHACVGLWCRIQFTHSLQRRFGGFCFVSCCSIVIAHSSKPEKMAIISIGRPKKMDLIFCCFVCLFVWFFFLFRKKNAVSFFV